MKKILRLMVWEECNRTCVGCCNKDWDLASLPSVRDMSDQQLRWYDEVLITGGEPMLHPRLLTSIVRWVKRRTNAKIYVYTAKIDDIASLLEVLKDVDGLTVTLHEPIDVNAFYSMEAIHRATRGKSMRCNIFKGVGVITANPQHIDWEYKENMVWIKDCPLPENEIFVRW